MRFEKIKYKVRAMLDQYEWKINSDFADAIIAVKKATI
jgi:hypothetical protein